MNEHKLSIIMPVFNEVNTVLQIIEKVLEQKNIFEIIVVDGSNDLDTIKFTLEMQPGKKQTLTYTVRTYHGTREDDYRP